MTSRTGPCTGPAALPQPVPPSAEGRDARVVTPQPRSSARH